MTVPGLIKRPPDQGQGEAVEYSAEDQKIDGRLPVFPVRAVQAQQDLSWWQVNDEQGDEKAHVQLLITEGPVCSSLLALRSTHAGHMGTQIVMIDASRGNHRQKDVNQALNGVDAEVTGVRFEVLGEYGSLLGSGCCGLHTFRTPQSFDPIKLDGVK